MLKKFLILFNIALALASSLLVHKPALAQAGSAYDLIAEVNALRAGSGLAAYVIDSELMGIAQSHSEYMASLGYWTHTRVDGSLPWQLGFQENVAMGTNMSTYYCVYSIWSDAIHWKTMMDYATGSVGAGVAYAGSTVYYTLDVRPGSSVQQTVVDQEVALVQQPLTYVNQIITSTPNPDGSVIHYVKYGESLWSIAIAYNTTGADIMKNTGNDPNVTDVYEGQMLVIRTAGPATPTVTPTITQIPPTPTNTPPRPTRTPMPTSTPGPSPTPTKPLPLLGVIFADPKPLGFTLIGISSIGLILVLIFGFFKKNNS